MMLNKVMSPRTVLGLMFMLAVLTLGCSVEAQAQKSGFFIANKKKVNIDSLNKQIAYWMDAVGVPALSFAVISNDQVVFSAAYGSKKQGGKEKVNRETLFEACSMTKSYLVYVVYRLVDQGKLDLDKPMYQYLKNEELEYDARYKAITPRMILSHASGIENWKDMNDPNKLEILNTPGEKYVYSGEGYHYLARVVEHMLNMPYEQYIREMVINPLKLERTITSYTSDKDVSNNDAIGHDSFGRPMDKRRNLEPVPAAGIHFIASDYAKLVIATFDRKHLSNGRVKDLLQPMVRTGGADQALYYGPGFEIMYAGTDTIIAQGGSNSGFKNMMFYSTVSKSGFVFLTNSDRGKALGAKLSEATVGLNIDQKYASHYFDPYPSVAIDLLRIYKEQNAEKMFSKIETLKREGKIGPNTLIELGDVFLYEDRVIAKRLLDTNIALYPQSVYSYRLLGVMMMGIKDYDVAYTHFKKARALNDDEPLIDYAMTLCEDKIKANASIPSSVFNVEAGGICTIQAERYCAMKGVETAAVPDNGPEVAVGWINVDDWMDYKIDVAQAGTYSIALRVASPTGSKFELRAGSAVLAAVDVPKTNGWTLWTTITTRVVLPAGPMTLRLHSLANDFNVNWFQIYNATTADHK